MANTFVTLKEIARQALPVLHQNLLFPNIIYTDYAQDFHGVGDTVKVRKPVIYEAGDFNEASGVQWQDIVEDSVEVTLDQDVYKRQRGCSPGPGPADSGCGQWGSEFRR